MLVATVLLADTLAALTFERDPAGKFVAVVLHQSGMDMRAPRE